MEVCQPRPHIHTSIPDHYSFLSIIVITITIIIIAVWFLYRPNYFLLNTIFFLFDLYLRYPNRSFQIWFNQSKSRFGRRPIENSEMQMQPFLKTFFFFSFFLLLDKGHKRVLLYFLNKEMCIYWGLEIDREIVLSWLSSFLCSVIDTTDCELEAGQIV